MISLIVPHLLLITLQIPFGIEAENLGECAGRAFETANAVIDVIVVFSALCRIIQERVHPPERTFHPSNMPSPLVSGLLGLCG